MTYKPPYPQDLHIHTVYSKHDSSVVPAQRLELVARVKHAEIMGISDHFEHFADNEYDRYVQDVSAHGFLVGTEVDGAQSVDFAASLTFDYYIYHCRDRLDDYRGADRLLATGRPVIIAHPNALDTDLNRVPPECLVELNNRYVWHVDWVNFYGPHKERFEFVISSDAHQPQWLGQSVARRAAMDLGLQEKLLEKGPLPSS